MYLVRLFFAFEWNEESVIYPMLPFHMAFCFIQHTEIEWNRLREREFHRSARHLGCVVWIAVLMILCIAMEMTRCKSRRFFGLWKAHVEILRPIVKFFKSLSIESFSLFFFVCFQANHRECSIIFVFFCIKFKIS